jgi:predicted dienelactone hydrolase
MRDMDAGIRAFSLTDEARPHWTGDGPRPIRTYLWYPTDKPAEPWQWADFFTPVEVAWDAPPTAGRHPVILLSHGTGGAAQQLAWLAAPLARAGYAVIAVDHHGNTATEPLVAEAFARWWDRPRDLTLALDTLIGEVAFLDLDRVGAAGFSLGGYTAAALVGARVDTESYRAIATGTLPSPPTPEYPDVHAELSGRYHLDFEKLVAGWDSDVTDRRVRAAFLIAPAVGEIVDPGSLAAIDRPVAVRWGDADDIVSPVTSAGRYAELIPGADARSVGADVGHYQFLAEATELGQRAEPFYFQDPPGVDRADLHRRVAAEAVSFFTSHLRYG